MAPSPEICRGMALPLETCCDILVAEPGRELSPETCRDMPLPLETCRDILVAEPGRELSPETCRDMPPLETCCDTEFDQPLGAFDGPRDPELGLEPALEADEGLVPERPISGTFRARLGLFDGLPLKALTFMVFRAALVKVSPLALSFDEPVATQRDDRRLSDPNVFEAERFKASTLSFAEVRRWGLGPGLVSCGSLQTKRLQSTACLKASSPACSQGIASSSFFCFATTPCSVSTRKSCRFSAFWVSLTNTSAIGRLTSTSSPRPMACNV
mmetsp:Transcript_40503/g.82725  ORF Transcript_40503/g.82725 Transcript_40503/m.82725 type:complete len:271 (+) Transcript_40503:224-1036(+)